MSDVEGQARKLVYTSVADAISSAFHASIPAIRRAIHIEQASETPRVALIRGLTSELRKKERLLADAPKGAA